MKRVIIALVGLVVIILILTRPTKPQTESPKALFSSEAHDEETAHPTAFNPSGNPTISSFRENNPAKNTATNLFDLVLAGERPLLTSEQAEAFLTANKQTAESLLAAYRGTNNKMYLREALERFPENPRVNFAGYLDAQIFHAEDYSIEERRAMLERFAKSAPENTLANYLAASEYFKSGEADKAVAQFRDATSKSSLNDYSWEFIQSNTEAYRQAGYSETDAKMIAYWTLSLPHISQLKQAGMDMLALAGQFQQVGNMEQAQEMRALTLHLGWLLQGDAQQKTVINQLVGVAIERKVLESHDPNANYDTSGRLVQDRIDELTQTRDRLKTAIDSFQNVYQIMTPVDQASFFDRIKICGEESAIKWAVEKYVP